MKSRIGFACTLALSSFLIVGMMFYASETFHELNKVIRRAEITFLVNKNLQIHERGRTELADIKPFIYLTGTEEGGIGIFGFADLANFWFGFSVFALKNCGFPVLVFRAVCGFSPL